MRPLHRRPLIALAILPTLLLALPFLLPAGWLIPRLEQAASDRFGLPVHVAALGLSLLPTPGLHLQGVEIGPPGQLRAETLDVAIDPASLFADVRRVESIRIERVAVTRQGLGQLPDMFRERKGVAAGGGPAWRIGRVLLREVRLDLRPIVLPVLDAEVNLSPAGTLAGVTAASQDGALKASLTATASGHAIRLEMQRWPLLPGIALDQVQATASLAGQRLVMDEATAQCVGGSLAWQGEIDWRDGWRLQGKLTGRGLSAEPLFKAANPRTYFSGRLDLRADVDFKAPSAAELLAEPRANVDFTIHQGVLNNLDLAAAARLVTGEQGGQTRFDEFKGEVQVAGKRYRFRNLHVSSGLLTATGQVDISPEQRLAGRLDVALRGTLGLIQVPLQVTGTVQEPRLAPTNAALAGAAAGSALLGPGLGTSLGAKVGGWVEKAFRKR